jgi:hypothetical protein
MIYAGVLVIHSWLRWLVLLAGVFAFVRATVGAATGKPWTPADDRAGAFFARIFDLQFLFGLVLYVFLSPFTHAAFGNFGAAMKDHVSRFWAVEHIVGMFIAAALVHIGQIRARKTDSLRRHRVAAIFFGLALAVSLGSIPWPGLPYARPLLRW